MLSFDRQQRRQPEPPYFSSKEVQAERRRIDQWLNLEDTRRRQTDPPLVWKLPVPSEVLGRLVELSHGRCAFCEMRRGDLEHYRFRPPANAKPDDSLTPAIANKSAPGRERLGKGNYIWLTFAWSNFFPICPDCRPSFQLQTHFPVTGDRAPPASSATDPGTRLAEKPLLLYPGEQSPMRAHFTICRDGTLAGPDPRWAATTGHFGLNREAARLAREKAIAGEIAAIERILAGKETGSARLVAHFDAMAAKECGGFAQRFIVRLIGLLPTSLPPWQSSGRPSAKAALARNLRLLAGSESAKRDLQVALKRIAAEDAAVRTGGPSAKAGLTAPPPDPVIAPPVAQPLRSIALRNFKSIEKLDIAIPDAVPATAKASDPEAPGTPCLMILGENATGKSSILEAVVLACIAKTQLGELTSALDLKPEGIPLNPAYLGAAPGMAKLPGKVTLEFGANGRRSFTIDPRKGAIVPGRGGATPPLLFAYGAHRMFGKEERTGPFHHIETLFDHGGQLSNPEPWLRGLSRTNPAALDEVASALRHIIEIDGKFKSIFFETDGKQPGACMLRRSRERPNAKGEMQVRTIEQPLALVSSGYRAIISMVCDIFRGLLDFHPAGTSMDIVRNTPALVLIDEIEAHLHPRWKLGIMRGLRKALPKATFMVTSHDPLCVRGMYNGEVVVLNRYDNVAAEGRGLPECLEQIDKLDNVEEMTVDQLLTSDLFQLGSTDGQLIERRFARIADMLARRDQGETMPKDGPDHALLAGFDTAIEAGLPYGANPVTYEVQRAVADVLKERRTNSEKDIEAKRQQARVAVDKFLKSLNV